MPVTVTTPERSLILGGPDDEPELYDLTRDPASRTTSGGRKATKAAATEEALHSSKASARRKSTSPRVASQSTVGEQKRARDNGVAEAPNAGLQREI